MPYTIPSSAITPGVVYQPKSKYILNRIDGAVAAWSTRRLISSAPADIARGRDASTNEEDFTAAELAGTGFTTLAGAGDGFYVTLYDQIGTNNATQATAASQPKGVDTGTLITDGVFPVLDFNSTENVLEVADNAVFDMSTELTFSCRFKNNKSSVVNFETIFAKYDFAADKRVFALRITNSNKITILLGKSLGTDFLTVTTNDSVVINEYNHLAFTFNSGVLKIYINGIAVNYTADDSIPSELVSANVNLTFGCVLQNNVYSFGSGSFLDGQLNDTIIFNRALSDFEISKLHTAL